jgi:hypothetical protein
MLSGSNGPIWTFQLLWQFCYDAVMIEPTNDDLMRRVSPFRIQGTAIRGGRCPKCKGNLLFEADVAEGLILRKCLQCGLIESYFWLERRTGKLVYLPVEYDQPLEADSA